MKKLIVWIIGVVVIIVALLLFVWSAYHLGWEWTGFVTFTTDKIDTKEIHLGKTLWDWLDLFIVPAFLAGGAIWLNRRQKERDTAIARERSQETVLQNYLDKMTELLLPDNNLRTSKEDSEVRSIARARTLTVLRSLDSERKGSVVQFLYESGLILTTDKNAGAPSKNPIVKLSGTDLGGAYLRYANLENAYLGSAYLGGAILGGAKLMGADLSSAYLGGAILGAAHLGGADLRYAHLGDTDLRYADLEYAHLEGAHLEGAKLTGADLTEATYNDNTKWPENFDPKKAGARRAQF